MVFDLRGKICLMRFCYRSSVMPTTHPHILNLGLGKIPRASSVVLFIIFIIIFSSSSIFTAASLDIRADLSCSGPGSGPTWLIRAARKVCRAFAEPALTAFYESPTLLSPLHLQALLKRPDQSINYNAKIKRIECAFQLFGSTSDAFDLSRLIPDTPQLAEIMITHPRDHPPYRIQKPPRWTYPSNLFLSLNELERRLKSWRWNVLLMEQGKQRHLTEYERYSKPQRRMMCLTVSTAPASSS